MLPTLNYVISMTVAAPVLAEINLYTQDFCVTLFIILYVVA